jgi:putative hydrolase of the HAD superfamily
VSTRIQAVTFVVGGTLIVPWPSVGHVYSEAAALHGFHSISAEMLNARFREVWHSQANFDYSREGWAKLVDLVFRELVPLPAPFFDELYQRFAEPGAWRAFDDVRPALDTLASASIRLGLISNWDERLRNLIERLRFTNYFEGITISCEIGFAKPSPVIFEQAAARLALPPSSILHVGDSMEMDFQGAKAAGFQALCLDRSRTHSDGANIHSLAELPAQVFGPISSRESFL